MDNDNNMTRDQLINLLEINEKRVNHVLEALREEEKHYTWISYILAGGLISVFLLIVQNIDKINTFLAIISFIVAILLGLLGITVCYIGYKAIRKEGEYYKKAKSISARILFALYSGGNNQIINIYPLDEIVNVSSNEVHSELRYIANKSIYDLLDPHAERGVRDWFQVTLVILGVLFAISMFISLILFIGHFC